MEFKMLITTLLILSIFCARTNAEADQEVVTTINKYLIMASNKQASPQSTSQASLTIASSNPLTTQSEPTSYTFPNHSLSPGCGRHISRCRELPILFEEQDSLVGILTPLNNAIGFMCFADAGKELVHQTTHILTSSHHDDCTPITIVKHKTKHYVVCIDSFMRVFSCSIELKFDNITKSFLQCNSLSILFSSVDFSEISNFVYVGADVFIFAVQDIVYKYYPERFFLAPVSGCTLPHNASNVRLVYNDIDTILIYYDTNEGAAIVVIFDLASECWTRFFTNVELQYSCFNGFNVFVRFPSDSSILYEMYEPIEEALGIGIIGINFTTGLCFGNASHSYFVYVDRIKGTLVLNIASENNTLISNSMCLKEYCWTPVLYLERYLILQEGGYLVVRDIEDSYKPVINVSDGNTGLIGFLTGRPYEHYIGIPSGSGNDKENVMLIIVWIVCGTIALFVLVSLAAGFILTVWRVKYRNTRQRPLVRSRSNSLNTYRPQSVAIDTPGETIEARRDGNGLTDDTNSTRGDDTSSQNALNDVTAETHSTASTSTVPPTYTPPENSQDLYQEHGLLPADPPHSHTSTTDQLDVEASSRQGRPAGSVVEANNSVQGDQTLCANYGEGEKVEPIEEATTEAGGDVAGAHFSPHEKTAYHPSSVAEKSNAKIRGEDNHNHSVDTMRRFDS